MSPLLAVKDLSLGFATSRGVVHALRNVSIEIPRGRIVGLVGESGSGKSTLALAILRLLAPNLAHLTGRIEFEGVDLLTLAPARMQAIRGRRIAMIFQDPMTSLNPVFTVETQLIDVMRAQGRQASRREMRERAVEMLHRVGISDPSRRIRAYPHHLSGGMRQRIMIAMALLAEPALLIADEPTTSLDVTIEAQIMRLFEDIRGVFEGSILFVSHSLGLVSALCDEVFAMYAGTVVETGSARDFFRAARHPYTRALIDCEIEDAPAAGRRLKSIPGEVPDLLTVPPGCIFADRCARAIAECRQDRPALRDLGGQRAACIRA
jgi:peptide/nickel transport system ATP-binding protein